MTTVSAIFENNQDVDNVINELHRKGFSDDEIGVMMSDERHKQLLQNVGATKISEGTSTGAMVGGALGAIVAGLAAVGSITIPGVGLLASGSLVAALAGGGAGAAVGGLTGALVGWGIPENEARFYEGQIKEGNILLTVKTDESRAGTIKTIFNKYRAQNIAA